MSTLIRTEDVVVGLIKSGDIVTGIEYENGSKDKYQLVVESPSFAKTTAKFGQTVGKETLVSGLNVNEDLLELRTQLTLDRGQFGI